MKKPCPRGCGGVITADARVFDKVMAVHVTTCPAPPPKPDKDKR